jgi:type II protein arginine methyltransferase
MAANPELSEAGFETLVRQAQGNARALAALSFIALRNGLPGRAYALANEARGLTPGDADIHNLTADAFAGTVPSWHFAIVRDKARNAPYRAAIERAVGPETRVLDIGTGTGLLSMMAARAGAGEVITCEMNPAVADAAAEIVALNGYSDRIRLIAKRSTDLDPDVDMGGAADLLVSEIVSNDLLREGVLSVVEDAVGRLLKPGGRMIPESAVIRVALAYWGGLADQHLGQIEGFDISPFNRLAQSPRKLEVGDPKLVLRSPSADLFDFDFTTGGPYRGGRSTVEIVAEDEPINGIVQWIRLRLDAETTYENRPGELKASSWAVLFYPLEQEIESAAGRTFRVTGVHDRDVVRIWGEAEARPA